MAKEKWVRVRGEQRADMEPDLMAHIVLMMARQLQQETLTSGATDYAEDDTAESRTPTDPGETP